MGKLEPFESIPPDYTIYGCKYSRFDEFLNVNKLKIYVCKIENYALLRVYICAELIWATQVWCTVCYPDLSSRQRTGELGTHFLHSVHRAASSLSVPLYSPVASKWASECRGEAAERRGAELRSAHSVTALKSQECLGQCAWARVPAQTCRVRSSGRAEKRRSGWSRNGPSIDPF